MKKLVLVSVLLVILMAACTAEPVSNQSTIRKESVFAVEKGQLHPPR
jgi:hypothetical protein